MNVVVLLRRLRARPDGAPAEALAGFCDRAAFAAGLALRDASRGGRVVAVAVGPAEREDVVLGAARAAGANRAVRVWDPCLESVDYLGLARVLAAATRHVGYDLVVAGDRSEDEWQGAVGPATAEALGVPHLTGALDAKLEGDAVIASRRDGGLVRRVKVPLPALLTVVAFPSVPDLVRCDDADPPETLGLNDLGIQALELRHRDRCLGRAYPVRVARNATILRDPDELIHRLRQDRLLER